MRERVKNVWLTPWERAHGPLWYVVGYRVDGSACVLAETHDLDAAERLACEFAGARKDYVLITTERGGGLA